MPGTASRLAALAFFQLLVLASARAGAADGQLDPGFGTGGVALVAGIAGVESPTGILYHPLADRLFLTGASGTPPWATVSYLNPDGTASIATSPDPAVAGWTDISYSGEISQAGWVGDQNSQVRVGVEWMTSFIYLHPETTPDPDPRIAWQPPSVPHAGMWLGPVYAFTMNGDWKVCRTIGGINTIILDTDFGSSGCRPVAFDLGGSQADHLLDLADDDSGPAPGRLVAVGRAETGTLSASDTSVAVARLTPSGALDSAFHGTGRLAFTVDADASGFDEARATAVRPDGWIALAGVSGHNAAEAGLVALVPPDGSQENVRTATFRVGNAATSFSAVAVDGDRIYVAGRAGASAVVGRLRGNLTPDPTFGAGGFALHDLDPGAADEATALTLLAGRPLATVRLPSDADSFAVVRLTSSLVFADGFEGGSTALWTAAAP